MRNKVHSFSGFTNTLKIAHWVPVVKKREKVRRNSATGKIFDQLKVYFLCEEAAKNGVINFGGTLCVSLLVQRSKIIYSGMNEWNSCSFAYVR